jgi:nucleoid DNA-binding protein
MARKKKPPKRKRTRNEGPVLKGAGFKKQDIAQKLIPLSVLSAKEAERAVDNVIAAITHVLGEGDLLIPDFGRFKASKSPKTGYIRILFTAAGKLKQAVEARLHANPSPEPDEGTDTNTTSGTDPDAEPGSESQSPPPSTSTADPTPSSAPAPEASAPSGPASESSATAPAVSEAMSDASAAGSPEQNGGTQETGAAQEASGTSDSAGSSAPGESGQPTGGADEGGHETEAAPESGGEPLASNEPAAGPAESGGPGESWSIDGSPSELNESSEILAIDSVSVEERSLIANGHDYKLAENLTILDVNGNAMNFGDQAAALQHLALVSRIIVISKTLLRVAAAGSAISIITTLQILQYRG